MQKEKSKKRPRLDKKTYEHHLAHLQEVTVHPDGIDRKK